MSGQRKFYFPCRAEYVKDGRKDNRTLAGEADATLYLLRKSSCHYDG